MYKLADDGAVEEFFQTIYEDTFTYVSSPSSNGTSDVNNLVRNQGIKTFFINYLLSNANSIGDFTNITQCWSFC